MFSTAVVKTFPLLCRFQASDWPDGILPSTGLALRMFTLFQNIVGVQACTNTI